MGKTRTPRGAARPVGTELPALRGQDEVPSQIHRYLSTNFHDLRKLPKDAPALRAKAKDRYYVPDPAKEADVQKSREKALLREFGSTARQSRRS